MTRIEADAVGAGIELRLSDENGTALFRLNTREVTILPSESMRGHTIDPQRSNSTAWR
jgi:hypothetical protein